MQPLCLPSLGGSLLLAACLALCYGSDPEAGAQDKETLLSGYPDSDIVYPVQTDEQGIFLSYDLSQRSMRKRDLSPLALQPVYYQLHFRGLELTFNVTVNKKLLAPGFIRERRCGGFTSVEIQPFTQTSCHLIGEVQTHRLRAGLAALSSCNGLMGLFQLSEDDYFIEPMGVLKHDADSAQPHRIYRHHSRNVQAGDSNQLTGMEGCGVKGPAWGLKTERWREHWEQKQNRRRRIVQRSVSQEKWVETLVVADPKMVEYHGSADVDSYMLTVMNMVAGLFHDPSIGNPINIVVVRLVLLERDEEDLKISHHADNTLKSFCKWQKSINPKGDAHPTHHDVAVLITRKDICAAMNRPCETLGLSHVSGMCQPHRSCNINEDTGLPLAFTVAHELAHSFGVQHDGSGNDCEPVGKRPFIMAPQLLYDTSPLTWSRCSRDYITRFLDRGWGLCLDDRPARERVSFPSVLPGVLYDVGHQCRLQYGSYSTFCEDIDSVCNTLWCSVGTTCHSKLDAAVDGTKCGESKWCFNGDCVPVNFHPGPIHGAWGTWSSWSRCSRTCGAGVQNAERQCSHPAPKYGGKYCLGERRRYRLCNTQPCTSEQPSFRQLQCSQFDALPYKGKLRTWIPVPGTINPCELHCRPEHEYFSEKLLDAVADGTPCYEGNVNRDLCINGICKNVGCDYEIDSDAVEDRCGVCHGNGSTCQTVKKTFEESEGLGYVDIGLIPAGAREIRIEEMAEAGNFLALRSEDPDKYFLNGDWTIQWNGEYRVAGTTFTYERTGNWENLTAPGPTMEPVWIQLLFQETNPGVRYQYTVHRQSDYENEIHPSEFSWRFGSWTACTVTCGIGVQRQIVYCVEKLAGIVEERYCDSLIRPDDIQRTCNEEPCPARWWVGEWQPCSASCGDAGLMKRTVLCIQSVRLEEQRALQSADCQHIPRPDTSAFCNRQVPCPVEWATGVWSECPVTCGTGIRRRLVYCRNHSVVACNATQRPISEIPCSLQDCPITSENPNWSGSGSSSQEIFNEIHHILQRQPMRPQTSSPEEENLIAEGGNFVMSEDFSNGRSRNIFVDDFYYDYNFINFHEDLFYDPLSEDFPGTPGSPETTSQAMVTDNNGQSPNISTGDESGGQDSTANDIDLSEIIMKNHSRSHIQDNKPEQASDTVRTTPVASSEPYSRGTEEQAGNRSVADSLSPSNGTRPHPVHHNSGDLLEEKSQEDMQRTAIPMENVPNTSSSLGYYHISDPTALQEDVRAEDIIRENEAVRSAESASAEEDRMHGPGTIHGEGNSLHGVQDREDVSEMVPDSMGPSLNLFHSQNTGWTSSLPPLMTQGSLMLDSTDSFNTAWTEGTQKSHEMRSKDQYSQNSDPQIAATQVFMTHFPLMTSVAPFSLVTSNQGPLDPTQSVIRDLPWHWNSVHSQEDMQPSGSSSSPALILQAKLDSNDIGIFPQTEQIPSSHPPVSKISVTSGDQHALEDARSPGNIPRIREPEITIPSHSRLSEKSNFHSVSTVKTIPTSSALIEQEEPLSVPTVTTIPTGSDPIDQEEPYSMQTVTSIPTSSHPTDQEKPHSVMTVEKPQWEVGNWSECSTTCGLGALWRTVWCSTGKDRECDITKKPIPARQCYLRPCALWHVGNWSKCSKNCGGGLKIRDVQCIDTRDQRLLRPFHCQAVLFKPPVQTSCQPEPCMDWYVSSWRECSEACGGGEQERLVTCPEFGRCDETLKPSNSRPCNLHPCTTWVVGSWGECTASCGGGIQRRLVKCINTQTGNAEEDRSMCDHEVLPENTQKCNPQDCNYTESSFNCKRDRLTFSFCQTLKLLGRCHLPTVKIQCCHTCRMYSHNTRERGNERASRR